MRHAYGLAVQRTSDRTSDVLDDPDAPRGSGLRFVRGDEWDDAEPVIHPEIIGP